MAQYLILITYEEIKWLVMDRELSQTHIQKERNKSFARYAAIVAVIILIFIIFYSLIKPSLSRSKVRTAIAERGSIQASVSASGTVQAEFEQVINSPIQSKIESVYLKAGEAVEKNQAILKLNQESAKSAFQQLKDEYDLRINKKTQLKLNLERSLIDLRSSFQIKKLTIQSLEKKVNQEQRLYKLGAGSKETLDQAKLNLEISKLELTQLDEKIKNQSASLVADLRELDLNIQIQSQKVNEQKSKLDQSETKSVRSGIVTYVNDEIGANINVGDVIARVADLSSFKVIATISDIYAAKLRIGGPVSVRINDLDLDGTISQINPSVENGIITFSVKLKNKSHQVLRSNLRVQVFVITSFKENIIRVRNGPFYNGSIDQAVFIIQGEEAVRRTVDIGVSNFDYVELLTQINEGDEVIITDMRDYQHMSEIDLED